MKRVYIAFERHKVAGKVFADDEKCIYLKPSGVFADREFSNELEFNQAVADLHRETPGALSGRELILLPVISFA